MLYVQQALALAGSKQLMTDVLCVSMPKTNLHETVIQPHSLLGVFQGFSEAREHHEGGCPVAIITGIFGAGILKTNKNKISSPKQLYSGYTLLVELALE